MNISFLGTGLMGNPMAQRLLKKGNEVSVYNRTMSKTENLAKLGAMVYDNPADAIECGDTIIVMLSDFDAVKNVLFYDGYKNFRGKTVIQMSTISPTESEIISEHINEFGGEYIEAPVLGSIPQVKSGQLFVLMGCSAELFEKWNGFLSVFGDRVIYFGDIGKASAAKLGLNQLIASLTTSFSMSLGYITEKGVDIDKFMEVLKGSALFAPTFEKKLENMKSRNFSNPNFPLKHLLKDVRLMEDEFGQAGINITPLMAVQEIIKDGLENNQGENDYSALYNSVHPK
ncbi:MAG: NAD(P)-dependent oxidoreductase [Melioribacteraceae bacterium]|nr:NAD(P)-dependent oxidoreductase [Melioribacteraceae bacterium]MCF8355131.1 NAD(P)-dependent oxidoreductase [Melioribacteraceae bacterium]MCF8392392.1 NAD(P)-dependent oxidoreductase [Melioribacteraceae bacterium]MCF8417913.1 NAD(P)-dependent oxidoreductase [Melioribacteraceae bacterium]